MAKNSAAIFTTFYSVAISKTISNTPNQSILEMSCLQLLYASRESANKSTEPQSEARRLIRTFSRLS